VRHLPAFYPHRGFNEGRNAVPVVDDLAVIPLALWAEESGYQRIHGIAGDLGLSNFWSGFDADAFPESHPTDDFLRGGLGIGIKPGGIVIAHAIDFNMIVMRGAFPWANRGVGAGFQKFLFYGGGGKYWLPSMTTHASLSAISFPAQNALP